MRPTETKPAKIAVALLIAGAGVLATGAAKESPLGPPPPRGTGLPSGQCIRSHDIRNHTFVGRDTVLVDVNGNATYRITVDGACLGGATASDPIITRNPPGSSYICKPIDLDLGVSRGGFSSQCIVQSIVKLTPEEIEKLPKKLRP